MSWGGAGDVWTEFGFGELESGLNGRVCGGIVEEGCALVGAVDWVGEECGYGKQRSIPLECNC